ncbi:hypothetical protein KIPB_008511 [Kipferlia bialata]|uniref:Uncharacterized protein n=1 Tax=Kipferlia bialata TaxID=797122 RepID=A0A9K3GLI3_9EUKA|nr:hypothetical protein KIPB_008511 [Kipferlia bialata]|eukprot:g8511.t1
MVAELRRGSSEASISSMCFSSDNKFLVVASNRKTIHVFALTQANTEDAGSDESAHNRQSAFGSDPSTVIVITSDGRYIKYGVDYDRKEVGQTALYEMVSA